MISDNNIRILILKAEIVSSLLNNTNLDYSIVNEYLDAENAKTTTERLDTIFDLLFNILKDNKLEVPSNINLKELFNNIVGYELSEENSNFYCNFLKYLIKEDQSINVKEKLDEVLEISHLNIDPKSSIRKLYIYSVLTLLLVSYPLDMNKINYYNNELKKYL